MRQSLAHHPGFEFSLELEDTASKTDCRQNVSSCFLHPGAERSWTPMFAQKVVSDIGLFGDQTLMLTLHVADSWPVGSGTAEPSRLLTMAVLIP